MDPVFLPDPAPLWFPDPRMGNRDGLIAIGGDLAPARLLLAYRSGIFPWYDEGIPPLWWSPDPRAVIPAAGLHVSRSLARRLRQGRFRLTWNRAFDEVIASCAAARPDGTWLLPEMIDAYCALHRMGHAHSLEVWDEAGDDLLGGIYGVQQGGLFAAESMFHRATDASKVALVACVRTVVAAGVEVFEVQMMTPHLRSMGAVQWSRRRYVGRLAEVVDLPVDLRSASPDWRPPG